MGGGLRIVCHIIIAMQKSEKRKENERQYLEEVESSFSF